MPGLLLFKNLVFTVLVPGTVGVYVPMMIARGTGAQPGGVGLRWLLGFALLGTGALVYMVCVMEFMVRGRGTPAPIDPPRALVVTGLYRYVRNPMYIGVLAVVFGWAALAHSAALLLYAAGLAGVFHLFIVLYEEPSLRRQFGDAYRRYCGAVPRWVPGRAYRG